MKKWQAVLIVLLCALIAGWGVYETRVARDAEARCSKVDVPAKVVNFQGGCDCGKKASHHRIAKPRASGHKKPAVVAAKKEQPAPKLVTAPVAAPAVQKTAPVVASNLLDGVDTSFLDHPRKVVAPPTPKMEQTKVVVVAIQAPPVYVECDSYPHLGGRCFNGTVYHYSSGYNNNTGYTGSTTWVQPYAPQPYQPIPVPHPQSNLLGHSGGDGTQPHHMAGGSGMF